MGLWTTSLTVIPNSGALSTVEEAPGHGYWKVAVTGPDRNVKAVELSRYES
jgi:hypothetical protein